MGYFRVRVVRSYDEHDADRPRDVTNEKNVMAGVVGCLFMLVILMVGIMSVISMVFGK